MSQLWPLHPIFRTRLVCSGSTAGFFLGDGAGVGKGRQIAAMIKEHHAQGGKRTLWLSVSNDLRFDAERDLADVGAQKIAVFPKVCCCLSDTQVFCECKQESGTSGTLPWFCGIRQQCTHTHRMLLVLLLTRQACAHGDGDKTQVGSSRRFHSTRCQTFNQCLKRTCCYSAG